MQTLHAIRRHDPVLDKALREIEQQPTLDQGMRESQAEEERGGQTLVIALAFMAGVLLTLWCVA